MTNPCNFWGGNDKEQPETELFDWRAGNEEEQLDWLADLVLDVLAERRKYDFGYIESKRRSYIGDDRLRVMHSLSNLDHENRAEFARKIGVSLDDFKAFLRVLSKL